MATKRTDISSETSARGGIPAAKSIKQKTMDEVLPKTNPDIPLRPMNNNDPNSAAYAAQQRATYAAGMQQAAAGKLSAEDRLMLRGVDQNISRGQMPAAKSIKQKTMDEVLPKTNPDIPLRPMNNNDPNKPVDAKEMNTIAAANSNHGIKNPPASAAPAAAQSPSPYGRGNTEPAVPGAVDPNSAAYAAQQRATYAAGMQQAAAGKLSAEDRLMLRGVDQNISRGQMPVISPTMPTQTATPRQAKASAPTASPDTSTAGFYAHAEKMLGPAKFKVFMSMPEAQRNAIYSKFVESQTKKAPAAGTAAGATAGTTAAPSGSRFPASALPSGNAPVPTSVPTTAGTGTAESMLRTLRDDTASPEARAQAQTYLRVRTMYAQPKKYGKEIKTLEKLERAKIKELSNMFRNRLNIRDPRFARQYAQYQALRKKDPQARLALYTELMKGPEFTHLDFRK